MKLFSNLFGTGHKWALYSELNEKIERISKWMHFIITKFCVIAAVAVYLTITLANYFILDRGDDSFEDTLLMYVMRQNSK